MQNLLWLIPALPLAGFLINGLLRPPRGIAGAVGCAGPIGAFALSVAAFREIPVERTVFEWFRVADFSIPFGLVVDDLGGIMLLVVTGVGSLIHVYSLGYMREDEGIARFFAYLNLFMFAMLVLVMADSIVLMFLGWEGVGLCSYLLIGFWHKDLKNADAGKKAFITNRIGDLGFLLGIFVLWQMFGTLDFARMEAGGVAVESQAVVAGLLLFVGACGKSAQIPLYVWLPDAMAGPTPVSALIHAATMVTAGVYMMARMGFLYVAAPAALEVVAVVAALTALMSALIAVVQTDIKKILAYSTISQIGFMFAGMAAAEFATGIFHVVTHAFFKALLFLGAGAVIHALHGEQDIRKMGGLAGPLRIVFVTFAIGALALAGMPFFSGFYSKDLILAAVFAHGAGPISAIMVVTAALTAFYSIRLVLAVFLVPAGKEHHPHPPGIAMTAPLVVLAILSAVGGLYLKHPIEERLGTVIVGPEAEAAAMAWSVTAFLVGAGGAVLFFLFKRDWVKRTVEGTGRGLHRLVSNAFYVDELYDVLVVAPVRMGAVVAWFVVDRLLIDGILVHGAGRLVYAAGGLVRRAHTGSLSAALVAFLAGAVAILGWLAYRWFA